MKVFLFVLAVIGAVVADEFVPKTINEIKVIRGDCATEYLHTAKQLDEIKNGIYVDEKPLWGFILCVAEKIGVFDAKHGYSTVPFIDQWVELLGSDTRDYVSYLIKNCVKNDEQNISVDVWAYRDFMCLANSEAGEAIKNFTIDYL